MMANKTGQKLRKVTSGNGLGLRMFPEMAKGAKANCNRMAIHCTHGKLDMKSKC